MQSTKDFMSGMGLGMIADQLADLKLGELLDTPPPGLDEAVAIAKVCNLQSACLLQVRSRSKDAKVSESASFLPWDDSLEVEESIRHVNSLM